MTSRRNVFLFSGYLLAFASLAPLAPLGGCGGDDSGAAADSGTDSPFEPSPDSGSVAKPDSGGSATHDSGGGSVVDAASDTGSPQGGDASDDTGTTQGSDAGGDTGTTQGTEDSGSDAGSDAGGGGAGEDASVPTGAIAIWNFDEGSGTSAFDSSGHFHTATLVNGATFAPGKHGTGLSPNTVGWAIVPATVPAPDAGSDDGGDAATVDASASDSGASDSGVSDASAADAEAGAVSDDAGEDASDASSASTFVPLVWDTTKSFSVGCWVKVYSDGVNQWQTAFSKNGEDVSLFTLKLRGDVAAPDFDFDFPGQDTTAGGTFTVAQSLTSPTLSASNGSTSYWYHLVGVLNTEAGDGGATLVSLYVNGSLQADVPPNGSIIEAVGDTIIGADLYGTLTNSWNGVIDEVYLYDRALTAAEVTALYTATQ